MSQVIQTLKEQIYLSKLLGFDDSIQYKVGKNNIVVDALSQPYDFDDSQLFILSMPQF